MSQFIEFISSGLHTSFQDQGRFGQQAFGVPISGALDKKAAQDALELLDLPANSAVLEITLLGPKIRFNCDCQIALTGAELSAKINDQVCATYKTLNISADDILSFGKALSGCRAYLAIRAQLDLQKWLGSISASNTETDKLTAHSQIKKGQSLKLEPLPFIPVRSLTKPQPVSTKTYIAVSRGPEYDDFSTAEKIAFFSSEFTIDSRSNRMAYRLNSESFNPAPKAELISSAVLPGTVQITSSGQALLLLADAQTTGGYPRFIKVLDRELDRLAQVKPGDKLGFILKK